MIVAESGLALMAYLPPELTAYDAMWRMALCGIGFAFFLTPNARLIVSSVPFDRAATIGGFVAMTRLTGQTLGATLTALLLAAHLGNGSAPALISCGLAIVSGVFSVLRLSPTVSGIRGIAP